MGDRERLRAVRHRALELAEELRSQAEPSPWAVCHGDPHLGNLIVVPGSEEVTLVDWDDAVLAPPERDLMFVLGGGVLPFAPVTDEQQSWFLDGYGRIDVDPDRLVYFRCVRTLEDITELAEHVIDTSRDREQRAESLGYVEGMVSPAGLVVQALRTASRVTWS